MPAAVRDSVLVLIPKPLKDPSNSDRCRPIALAIQISVKPWNVAFSSTTGLLKVIRLWFLTIIIIRLWFCHSD